MKVFGNLRFRTKLIIVSVMILIFNSVISGGLYYNRAYGDTLRNYYSSSEDMVSQMKMQLSGEMRSITGRVYAIVNNLSFYTPMSQYLQNPDSISYVKLMGEMSDVISEFYQGDRYVHSVSIETEHGSFDNFTRIREHDFHFMESFMHDYFLENPGETICRYPAMKSPIFKGSELVIPVVYRFRISQQDLYIVVSLQQSEIEKFLKDTYDSYDSIFIADAKGENVLGYDEDKAAILAGFEELDEEMKALCREVEYNGENYLATLAVMSGSGWKICALKKADSLVGDLKQLRIFILILMLVSVAVSIVLIVIVVRGMTAPLGRLSELMNRASKSENFDKRFDYPYTDEIGALGQSFNYMTDKIDHLIGELGANIEELREEKERVKLVELQKRKAELKALQAQINPHFLYNTLNAITWQATDSEVPEIAVLSNSLGKFYRVSLSGGREVITIGEELEHVRNYLRIQGIRYKDKLQYEMDIEDGVESLYTIKLIIQPLVENAIYHGIKPKEGIGHIKISVRRLVQAGKRLLQILVEDDGEGIKEDRLIVIRRGLTSGYAGQGDGYGIYNVNERLKLGYGDDYGLTIDSVSHKGTRAIILMPIMTTEEG
ncbi:sensor histidine kinase [Butyrivibrio sp. MC2013]|uniref:sensor histidine kinase n=1 Tax=Butyrivibrio sp. MC2013 TaxID=1280686 RepID=UPI0003FAE4A0|nr:sensor histidine kinase [Butyrivibrio sp. MC2013]